jgi:hypothetical protein
VSVSPYRLPEQQSGPLNPWQLPAPPHAAAPAASTALLELHRLRVRHAFELSDDRTWGKAGLLGCAALLLVLPLGCFLGGWIFLLALKLGLLPAAMGYLVLHLRRKAKRTWCAAYTAMYLRLATTSLPLQLAEAGRPGPAGGRPSLAQAMLQVARQDGSGGPGPLRLDAGQLPPAAPQALDRRLSLPARARFAAIYDFFFHPQEGVPAAAPAEAPG